MSYNFRIAKQEDLPIIWDIIQKAILRRKKEGSNQWQDGYPNPTVLKKDIKQSLGYVLTIKQTIVCYCCIGINNESEYSKIEGKWISNSDYVVFHRVAVSEQFLGKGYTQKCIAHIEKFALDNNIFSIKADTNFDNQPMLYIFNKMGYQDCGKVYFRGSPRIAFEKILTKLGG